MSNKLTPNLHDAQSAAFVEAETVVLENGLRILLVEDHSAPVVSLQNWVKFGGADEEVKFAGIAHVFEHMLFKGSKEFPNGEMAGTIEGAGGQVNAWTSNDETVYYVTLSSRYWEQGFAALVDAVINPLFDEGELIKEKEVIQEEIRRGKDDPDREMWHRLAGLAYRTHPYGRPVIGFPETVDKTDRNALLRIFQQWYVPNNMVFVAVGDFDKKKLVDAIRSRYGHLPNKSLPQRPRSNEERQTSTRVDVLNFRAELARVEVSFPGIAATDKDVAALDLLGDLLGSGYNSQLYTELKRKRNIAHDVSAYNYTPIDPGMFMLGASCSPENTESVVTALLQQARQIQNLDIGNDQLEAAKMRIVSQFVHAQETYQGIARTLGRFDTTYGDPNFSRDYVAAVKSVQLEDLRRVASRIVALERANVVVMLPEGQPLPSTDNVLSWVRNGYDDTGSVASNVQEAGRDETANVVWYDLPGGIRLVVQQDLAAPVVSVNAAFGAGIWVEPADKGGSARLLASLWNQGTSLRSASQIERELDAIGGSVGASSSQDMISVSGRFLLEKIEPGFDLFFDILNDPIFPEQELDIERQDQIREIESLRENKFRFTAQHFQENFYRNHPYGKPALGTVASVRRVQRDDLQKLHGDILENAPLVIAISGNLEPAKAAASVSNRLAGILAMRDAPNPKPYIQPDALKKLQEIVVEDKGNQTHIMWGFATVDRMHKDRAPLTLLDAVLSGMGGRLFMELRDQKSLAYMVTAFDSYPNVNGYFAFYIACAPDKEKLSIQEFERVIAELIATGITEEELERAKRYLLGSVDIQLQSTSARAGSFASSLLLRGRWDGHREYVADIEKVSLDDVKRVAREYLVADRSVRVVLRAK